MTLSSHFKSFVYSTESNMWSAVRLDMAIYVISLSYYYDHHCGIYVVLCRFVSLVCNYASFSSNIKSLDQPMSKKAMFYDCPNKYVFLSRSILRKWNENIHQSFMVNIIPLFLFDRILWKYLELCWLLLLLLFWKENRSWNSP